MTSTHTTARVIVDLKAVHSPTRSVHTNRTGSTSAYFSIVDFLFYSLHNIPYTFDVLEAGEPID